MYRLACAECLPESSWAPGVRRKDGLCTGDTVASWGRSCRTQTTTVVRSRTEKRRHLQKCTPPLRSSLTAGSLGKHCFVAICRTGVLSGADTESGPPKSVCDTYVRGSGVVRTQETSLLQGQETSVLQGSTSLPID